MVVIGVPIQIPADFVIGCLVELVIGFVAVEELAIVDSVALVNPHETQILHLQKLELYCCCFDASFQHHL